MAKTFFLAASDSGLSGTTIRSFADTNPETQSQISANAIGKDVEKALHEAFDLISHAIEITGNAINEAVDAASNKAFESAANVGANIADPAAQPGFSWGGYFQAIGILCLLLAALWFGVWLIRKYGKFNFLPRPGSLPKDALVMEAQMPLGPKKGLMVVKFCNRRLLLGVTDQQITLLTEESPQDDQKHFQDYMDSTGADSN